VTTTISCFATNVYQTGLSTDMQEVLEWIKQKAQYLGMGQPILLSTCRTYEHQKNLQERWDNGERSGIRSRPANPEDSLHVAGDDGKCRAFDLGNSDDWLGVIGPRVVGEFPTVEWGGNYINRDPNHFEKNTLVRIFSINLI
jgi:hypothetical protein